MQIDSCLIAASYQETVSCRYNAHWYVQWSPMAEIMDTQHGRRKSIGSIWKEKILRKIYGPV